MDKIDAKVLDDLVLELSVLKEESEKAPYNDAKGASEHMALRREIRRKLKEIGLGPVTLMKLMGN